MLLERDPNSVCTVCFGWMLSLAIRSVLICVDITEDL